MWGYPFAENYECERVKIRLCDLGNQNLLRRNIMIGHVTRKLIDLTNGKRDYPFMIQTMDLLTQCVPE